MKDYDVYLFDWDGCLAKTLEVWLHGFRETFREFGLNPTNEEIIYEYGNLRGPLNLGVTDLVSFRQRLTEIIGHDLRTVDTYSGANDLLKSIKAAGKPMALISSSYADVLHDALKHNKLDHFFEVIISGDDVEKHKPDPFVIYEAIEKLGRTFDADNTIIVGDSKSDLGAANNAGIDSVLMYPASHELFYKMTDLKKFQPTYIFESFAAFQRQFTS